MFSKLNKFFWNLVESFWFLLVFWTSCNELFNTFLVSGDVCDEVCVSQFTSIKMFKSFCGVNASVFFPTWSLKANPSCVPQGEMLDIDDLDPVEATTEKVQERRCGFGQS